jgi:CDP-diacylglycerol--glycerol-3-phosphate 3-phosphatidyltransferase
MTGEKVNPIPNILTMIRLIGGLVMFLLLAGGTGGIPFFSAYLSPDTQFALQRWALYMFVIAALTDFFDGFLARKLHAESRWGAILDPIADKILVCGTILGLFALNTGDPVFALPSALILFREFAVSALVAGQGQDDDSIGGLGRHAAGRKLGRLQFRRRPRADGLLYRLYPAVDRGNRIGVDRRGLLHPGAQGHLIRATGACVSVFGQTCRSFGHLLPRINWTFVRACPMLPRRSGGSCR